MKEEWRFKISSELKNILGRDLITDSNIAILELVKNSFDAHATEVTISFENDQLTIADNGKGMSEDDIQNKWLFVAYSAKKDGTEDNDYRDNIKRKYAGAKGIGRLSCDRLGRNLTLYTKTKNCTKVIEIKIDWNDFEEDAQKEFNGIILKHRILDKSSFFKENESGTVLKFTGLRDNWDDINILKLRKSLEKLINPFNGMDEFTIIFNVPSEINNDQYKRTQSNALRKSWDQLSERKQTETVKIERSIINGPIANTIADTLNLKTTRIDSYIKDGVIRTILSDRGTKLYEIEETNKFPLLENATVTLFYLNKPAKYNFSIMMGVPPVRYGSVFLFRNGFRIMPYGEYKNDMWGLDQRYQQGYGRTLSSRSLLGRVDVETGDPNKFKEVSSRDGGLVVSPEQQELMEFFNSTLKRIERYVVGVLWGEGFIRREYFSTKQTALDFRDKLLTEEKNSESINHIMDNIGSKVDFLQIVKSLADDSNIKLIYYNEDLANIINKVSETEILQNKILEDFKKVAFDTNDSVLLNQLTDFERQVDTLRRQKEEAENKAKAEKEKAKAATLKAKLEKEKREKEERKRKEAERALLEKQQQNLFLLSVGTLDNDRILKYHHDIRTHSATIHNTIGQLLKRQARGELDSPETQKQLERISRANDRINSIAQFATKANYKTDTDIIKDDIVKYIHDYVNNVLPEFYGDLKVHCTSNGCSKIIDFSPIEGSIFIDNLISNTSKFDAREFKVDFKSENNLIVLTISDDGEGLDPSIPDPNVILEKGFTTTTGSGLGLYNVANFVSNVLKGSISISSNSKQRGFEIIITF